MCAENLPKEQVYFIACEAFGRFLFVVQPNGDFMHFPEIEVFPRSPFELCLALADARLARSQALDTRGLSSAGTQEDLRNQVIVYLTRMGYCRDVADCQSQSERVL